jgi:membrane-bound metal-dependent hydrolase YbcI (DUF457 family)
MPVTPFHFGPGALIKVLAPASFSWSIFALANVLIDLEPILLYLTTGDPAHPWLHTLPGALLVTTVAATVGRKPCEALLRLWNWNLSTAQARWLGTDVRIGRAAAWNGALLGTLSHLALDSFMHSDVRALWPFVTENPWRGVISLDVLHWSCVGAGGVALLAWGARRLSRRRP